MNFTAKKQLEAIGHGLDRKIFPSVFIDGVVRPCNSIKTTHFKGQEQQDEYPQQQPQRPSTTTRPRPQRWQRTPRRVWTPSQATSIISPKLQNLYLADLGNVKNTYPNTEIWENEEGVWLITSSQLLDNISSTATFAVCIPFSPYLPVKGWGFWNSISWIGPRHTNFPDGSICAFEPSDGTWVAGDSIVSLLDLYSLWAVRHLFLKEFRYWPGQQAVHEPYERITELNNDELCGCGSEGVKYKDCCQNEDLKTIKLTDAIRFITAHGSERCPPNCVLSFLQKKTNPPQISDIY